MTVSFYEIRKKYSKALGDRLHDVRVPPQDEIAAFRSSPVGHALAHFYENMAVGADHDLHGISDIESSEGRKSYLESQATIDAALAFFALQEAWDEHHARRTTHGEGRTNDESDL